MAKVLPLPQARHDFITAAVQWAASKRMQMNLEGVLLSSILISGTGGNVPLNREPFRQALAVQVFREACVHHEF